MRSVSALDRNEGTHSVHREVAGLEMPQEHDVQGIDQREHDRARRPRHEEGRPQDPHQIAHVQSLSPICEQ